MPETLRREANPPSGQLAAPLPQAWDAALKDFRKLTGELVQDSADPDARRFAMDVIPWSKTTGGVWVPGQVNAQLTGSKVTPAQTLFSNQQLNIGVTSPWIPCAGYNRAIMLVQFSGGTGNTSIAIEGRVDSDIATLAMYFLNTGVAVTKTAIPGYYELDINPMTDIRARIYGSVASSSTVTIRAWFSASVFVPDSPGAAIPVFSSLAVRSAGTLMFSPVVSGWGVGRSRLIVDNTHDQPLRLQIRYLYGSVPPYKKADGTTWEFQIPAGVEKLVISPSDWPLLDGMLPEEFQFAVYANTAPTTGTLSMLWMAEPSA